MSTRNHRLDRAKGVLIFTVVLGHLLARASPWDADVLRAPMYLIYSFHMPAFIFLAGITAKSNRLAERILVFLVLLATVLPLMWMWMQLFGLSPDYDFLTPFWYSWFLLSMAWWTLTVPLIERFPRTVLAVSLVTGLVGAAVPAVDSELSVVRTLVFWPFFVVGKLYGARMLQWAGSLDVGRRVALTVAAVTMVGFFYVDELNNDWFYGNDRFVHFGVGVVDGAAIRLVLDVAAMLMTLALLAWVGERNSLLATVGRNSLSVYVVHGFVVRALQPTLGGSVSDQGQLVVLGICLVLALVATWLLAWGPLDRALRWYASTVAGLLLAPFRYLASGRDRGPSWRPRQDSNPRPTG
ncbi:acyltransferase family protein [Corynebacterium sp.]|uniref:acyltransferase family protein n=1 Tax=Corynebacterium sp. TaxID=1720 RepID=UPI0034138CB1